MCELPITNPYFAATTQYQDNLHDTAFPKVKHTDPGARLCFYNKRSSLSIFFKWIGKKDDLVTGFSRSRFNFPYGCE